MLRRALPVLFLMFLVGCGGGSDGGSPSPGPSPTPTPTTFTLSGQVLNDATGVGVSGANVTILDGPNAGRSTTTDGNGSYTLTGLQTSGFSVRGRAQFYNDRSEGVTLTADRTQNIRLIPIPLFTKSGGRNSVFDMPTHVRRIHVFGRWNNQGTSNFIVRIGGSTVVNAILRNGNPYEGIHTTTGGVTEIRDSENIVEWRFTEVR